MIEIDSEGIYEIRCVGKEIRLIFRTEELAIKANMKSWRKVMDECDLSNIF